MEISLYLQTGKHHTTGHNDLEYVKTLLKNPTISAYTATEGKFVFNKTPLAPPGTKVLVHKKPQQWKTWGIHGVPRWYIGPEMEH